MPWDLYSFGLALWKLAYPFLGDVSQRHPPTSCQAMLCACPPLHTLWPHRMNYLNSVLVCAWPNVADYALFSSFVSRHRDNFNTADAVKALCKNDVTVLSAATGHSISTENSQMPCSDVLVG